MVDHATRNRAYSALRRFINGETTNDEFESEYPDATKTGDRAIKAIETMAWQFYSDHEVHTLTEQHAPDEAGRALLQRALLFLKSDQEYAWPIDNFIMVRDAEPVLNTLTLGAMQRRKDRQSQAVMDQLSEAGDMSAWPFVSQGDIIAATEAGRADS